MLDELILLGERRPCRLGMCIFLVPRRDFVNIRVLRQNKLFWRSLAGHSDS